MPPGFLHQQLIADSSTQASFRRACRAVVKSGDVVLDAGCGTGIHSVFACQAGARRVYAIDRGRVSELARRVIADNGFADRVTVIQGEAGEVELPEPVDVVITHLWIGDLVALMPLLKRRFLRPGGAAIPRRLDIFAGLVEAADLHHTAVGFWKTRPQGVEFDAAAEEALRRTYAERIEPEQLVTGEERVTSLDLETDSEPWFRASVATTARRAGEIHGLSFSFEEWLTDEIVISTRLPTILPKNVWPHFFLPLRIPLAVAAGDALSIAMRLRLGPTGFVGEWSVAARGEPALRQAVLEATSLAPPRFPKGALRLTPSGEVRRFVLDACDGALTASEIIERVRAAFPDRFRSPRDAELYVAEVTRSLLAGA